MEEPRTDLVQLELQACHLCWCGGALDVFAQINNDGDGRVGPVVVVPAKVVDVLYVPVGGGKAATVDGVQWARTLPNTVSKLDGVLT